MYKSILKRIFSFFGYSLLRNDLVPKELLKELAPKNDPAIDKEFQLIRKTIIGLSTETEFDLGAIPDYTIYNSVKYIVENDIQGDFVECGVLAGAKIMMILQFLVNRNIKDRDIYLYDTFAGMTEPSEKDRKFITIQSSNQKVFENWNSKNRDGYNEWGYVPIDIVRSNIECIGYPMDKVHFIKGDVCKTLPNKLHDEIALLRLDTDFYESSKHELEELYHKVVNSGVVILDDYGGFEGQKIATDEFFENQKFKPLLVRTCRKERVLIKVR